MPLDIYPMKALLSGGTQVPLYSTKVPCSMYISQALCRVGRSQSIVLGSYVYIPGPMSGGKVPEYSNGTYVYFSVPMLGGKEGIYI